MFITLEGVEGCGKTTQAAILKDFLESKGNVATVTREPGWGKFGTYMRTILLDDKDIRLDYFAELCLYCADRSQHVRGLILPEIEAGRMVVCDRFSDSTVAYQGYGRKINLDLVKKMAWHAADGVIPFLTFVLDLPPEVGLNRIGDRVELTKMDEETLDFHKRVREGFKKIASEEPKRVIVIDAEQSIEEVSAEINSIVERVMD